MFVFIVQVKVRLGFFLARTILPPLLFQVTHQLFTTRLGSGFGSRLVCRFLRTLGRRFGGGLGSRFLIIIIPLFALAFSSSFPLTGIMIIVIVIVVIIRMVVGVVVVIVRGFRRWLGRGFRRRLGRGFWGWLGSRFLFIVLFALAFSSSFPLTGIMIIVIVIVVII